MDGEIFHILEIDLPLGDGTFKRFWYGSISTDDGIIKMSRIEDLKSWEFYIYRRSEEISSGDKIQPKNEEVKIKVGKDFGKNRKEPYILS
ncbi:hypothetical protein MACK_003585 [Theileria orientalis]|uniref:Uncharacterized protein n=1 Tax=Theileria orientalis TaxID=68886 RepID=A0A976XHZ3_THEOR|nr:hypothetical protein MACK_003585 [Theileria orientalis]